jgi:uncharacterized 2Fe-2S/4Fe-4S cluster protein (DUF4445 family)
MKAPVVKNPKGEILATTQPVLDPQSLADWLASCGHPLNTRCGGRGLCRGCRVKVDGEDIKACQTSAVSLAGKEIMLLRSSVQDTSMQGITAFELSPERLAAAPLQPVTGIAIDVGTTTLAAAAWKGEPPQCTATASIRNPQIRLGDNVVSRVQYSLSSPDALKELQELLIREGILPLLKRLGDIEHIEELTLTGNPVMLHLIAGESVAGFASYPFRPGFIDSRELDPALFELPQEVRIRLLPGLGPFVGSDVSAGALACGMLTTEAPSLLIDFGTNGEILLKTEQSYFATATAAGPAFEGGRLKCGSTAGKGVIGLLKREEQDTLFRLPESEEPWHGIAGTAFVDAMVLGRKAGWLNSSGRFTQGAEPFQLAPGVEITEADIAELLQAKAAIQAGWTTLCEVADTDPASIKSVFVAGGFGYHLQPAHAVALGLLPPVPVSRIQLVGNSSLA